MTFRIVAETCRRRTIRVYPSAWTAAKKRASIEGKRILINTWAFSYRMVNVLSVPGDCFATGIGIEWHS